MAPMPRRRRWLLRHPPQLLAALVPGVPEALISRPSSAAAGAELIVDGGGTALPMVIEQDPSEFKA